MSTNAKKWIGLVAAAMLLGAIALLASCGSSAPAPNAASSDASASSSAVAPVEETSNAVAPVEETSNAVAPIEATSSEAEQIANPWSDAASAEEAAQGAGLEAFPLPEGAIGDLGEPFEITYRYMDGMAEARYEFAASAVTVRTAKISSEDSFDISGDYNTYAYEWTETIENEPIACAGNREGESIKTYWGHDDRAHSLVAQGLGGDSDFGLTPDRLAVFVTAMEQSSASQA